MRCAGDFVVCAGEEEEEEDIFVLLRATRLIESSNCAYINDEEKAKRGYKEGKKPRGTNTTTTHETNFIDDDGRAGGSCVHFERYKACASGILEWTRIATWKKKERVEEI